MHDANGTPLKKGDKVLIEAVVATLYEGEDYCNVTVKSVLLRQPDNTHEHMTLNTHVLVKYANAPEEAVEPASE